MTNDGNGPAFSNSYLVTRALFHYPVTFLRKKLNKCNTVIIQIPDTRIPVIQLFRHGQVLGYCVILVRSSCNLLKT